MTQDTVTAAEKDLSTDNSRQMFLPRNTRNRKV